MSKKTVHSVHLKVGTMVQLRGCCSVQVHDELLFEVKENAVAEVCTIIRRGMEDAVVLEVPLKVKIHAGPSWGELQLIG